MVDRAVSDFDDVFQLCSSIINDVHETHGTYGTNDASKWAAVIADVEAALDAEDKIESYDVKCDIINNPSVESPLSVRIIAQVAIDHRELAEITV